MAGALDVHFEKLAATSYALHVSNNSGAAIPEVRVELDGALVDEHPAFVHNQPDRGRVEDLEPGKSLGYLLVAREESHGPPYQLRIVHTDGAGVTHEYSSRIG